MSLAVSVIIPAYNAATTLAETLASVQAQSHAHWEALVVDNGSTDGTAAVASQFAARDPRIRLIDCPEKGVSRARNGGITHARHDWILFLDADDSILPRHLEVLTEVLLANPDLDAVHCGWRRVTPDGETIFEEYGSDDPDLFPLLARTCAFAIHTCIVRRALIVACSGFDSSLRTCEDWDLWQRLARGGARFAHHPEILAVYRARPQSASMDGHQMIADGFEVIGRAFAPDPRVPAPLPAYARGLPPDTLPQARLDNLIWQAGLLLGAKQEAHALFNELANDPPAVVDPTGAATSLFEALLLPSARPPHAWWELLLAIAPQLERFLAALERHTRQVGLAGSIRVQLESRAVRSPSLPRPSTIGRTHCITLQLAAPFPDLALPPTVERLHCRAELDGDFVGELELPVCDGLVPADVLADATAAEFAWPLLGRFLRRAVYPQLAIEREETGWTIRRGASVLARNLQSADRPTWETVHDAVGWPIFVQEAWGLGTPPDDTFYNLEQVELRPATPGALAADAQWLVVDLVDPVPARQTVQPHVDVVLTVAGVPTARAPLTVPRRTLSAATLRAALMVESGFELCRACVREALLQRPLDAPGSLRQRLRAARTSRSAAVPAPTVTLGSPFMPGADARAAHALGRVPGVALWARHPLAPCGTSASRRMLLPRAAWSDLRRVATTSGEQLVGSPGPNGAAHAVLYTPDLLWRPTRSRPPAPAVLDPASAVDPVYNREFFEALFASGPDPWGYTSSYEQTKYEQTLQLIPPRRFRRALEIACAEGHFTVQLAPRVEQLTATDISALALRRAQQRCAGHGHVTFQPYDLFADPLPTGVYDLIVCSEVLYYVGSRTELEVIAEKLALALEPGGCLVCAHAHVRADDPTQPGFDWEATFGVKTITAAFGKVAGLHLVEELRTPLYRVQRYQRPSAWQRWRGVPKTRYRTGQLPDPLPARVAEQVRWDSAPVPPQEPDDRRTDRLPILMYHRVATDGPAALARYRIAPAQFEAQLRWLREEGYESATLEEWRAAAEVKRPLRGRRVLLTFDDGCVDFATTAWPLLQQYGFGAVMFLPTDYLGRRCEWDLCHGEPARVMDWDAIRSLQKAGVEFGSHTASHPLLTGLALSEVAREALRSRAMLEEQLGAPVNAIAYPFGATDRIVEQLCGAAGYLFGLTCAHRCCEFEDRLLALPRLEVSSDLTLEHFSDLLDL